MYKKMYIFKFFSLAFVLSSEQISKVVLITIWRDFAKLYVCCKKKIMIK